MGSIVIIAAIAAAGLLHGLHFKKLKGPDLAEFFLVYFLVLYCGFQLLGTSIADLVASLSNASIYPFPPAGASQQFFGFSLLGMFVIAISAIWMRGKYLIAPTIGFSIFWLGATAIHFAEEQIPTIQDYVVLFFAHALISVIMLSLWFIANRPALRASHS
jgi:hypothetical protein